MKFRLEIETDAVEMSKAIDGVTTSLAKALVSSPQIVGLLEQMGVPMPASILGLTRPPGTCDGSGGCGACGPASPPPAAPPASSASSCQN